MDLASANGFSATVSAEFCNVGVNLAKSKFRPGPGPKSDTRTYEVTGQQEKMTGKQIDAQGNPTLFQFTANRDGKDYPYGGSREVDTIYLTPVDTSTVTYANKKAGEVVFTGTRFSSAGDK